MKTFTLTLLVLCAAQKAFGQGALQFYADMLAPIESIPGQYEKMGHALFSLHENSRFTGYADFYIFNSLQGLRIEDSAGSVIFAAPNQVTFDNSHSGPFDILVAEWDVTLTGSEANKLIDGEFLIVAQSARFPPNYVYGQVALIPEPSTMALFVLSGCALLLISTRLKEQRPVSSIKESMGMKGRAIAALAGFISVHSLSAQGTVQFYADMRAPIEVRPDETDTTGEGFFTLNDNFLNGYVRFSIMNYLSDLWMEDGTGTRIAIPIEIKSELPPDVMCPCSGVLAEWEVGLTEAQTSQLMAGEFLIRAESTASPPNYVTGQLTLIPEPGVWTILSLGGVLVYLIGSGQNNLHTKSG